MRHLTITIAALAFAACSGGSEPDSGTDGPGPAPDAVETLEAVPVAFHGRWDFAEDTCADEGSEMRLAIAADSLTYYESAATPTTVTRTTPNTIVIEHLFTGEGEEWTETLAYELSEDGDRLTVTSPDGSMSIRMLCPV